jgi:hypothetical protein
MKQTICNECKSVLADEIEENNEDPRLPYVHITAHKGNGETVETDICFGCLASVKGEDLVAEFKME